MGVIGSSEMERTVADKLNSNEPEDSAWRALVGPIHGELVSIATAAKMKMETPFTQSAPSRPYRF